MATQERFDFARLRIESSAKTFALYPCRVSLGSSPLISLAASGPVTFLTLLIEFAMAFVGGFTADRILSQLSELRVLREYSLDQAGEEHESGSVGAKPRSSNSKRQSSRPGKSRKLRPQ